MPKSVGYEAVFLLKNIKIAFAGVKICSIQENRLTLHSQTKRHMAHSSIG